jgi:hypothetical protein
VRRQDAAPRPATGPGREDNIEGNTSSIAHSSGELVLTPGPALQLIAEINNEHRLAKSHADQTIKHAVRCGELLLQQKDRLPHGQFMAWIAQNCEFSGRSARNYMKVAENFNNGSALPLSSLRQALLPPAENLGAKKSRREGPARSTSDEGWRWKEASPTMRALAKEAAKKTKKYGDQRVYNVILLMDLLGVEKEFLEHFKAHMDAGPAKTLKMLRQESAKADPQESAI